MSIPTNLTAESKTDEETGKTSKTIAYFTAFIILGMFVATLGPTLPGLAEHTLTQLSQISFLFTARSFGYLLGSLRGGRAYDRVPGHPLLVGMLLTMAAMMALTPLVSRLWLLTIVMLILGIGEGTFDVGANVLLVWVHRHKVGPYMNGLHFFFGLGAFISPIIVAQAILVSGDINWAYWLLALCALPVAAWIARLPSPTTRKDARDTQEGNANILLVALIVVFFFLYVGAEVSFGGWIFTYTTALGLGGAASAAYLTSAFWGSLTLGRLLAVPIAIRLRPRVILLADIIGCLVSVGVILSFPNSIAIIWVGTAGIGLSMASIFPTMLTFAERHMATTGRITRWFFVGAGVGGMFLPWLIGQVFESIGPRVTMYAILADLVAALFVFAAVMAASKRIPV